MHGTVIVFIGFSFSKWADTVPDVLLRFLEHGEYDKQMYGTTTQAIKQILNSGKVHLEKSTMFGPRKPRAIRKNCENRVQH